VPSAGYPAFGSDGWILVVDPLQKHSPFLDAVVRQFFSLALSHSQLDEVSSPISSAVQHDPPGSRGSTRSGTERRQLTRHPKCGGHGLLPVPSRNAIPQRRHGRCGIFSHWLCRTVVSADPHLQTSLSQKSGQDGAVARGREAAAHRADAACPMTRPQDGAAGWSIGSGGREEGGTDADF
jgi:hypothetical protein